MLTKRVGATNSLALALEEERHADLTAVSGGGPEDDLVGLEKKKRRRRMTRVSCDRCYTEVFKKNLKVHQASKTCQMLSLQTAVARLSATAAATNTTQPVPLSASIAAIAPPPHAQPQQPQRYFKPRKTRARICLDMVSADGAVATLREWMLSVAMMHKSTVDDAISALRKVLAFKYGSEKLLTLQELCLGLIDTANLQKLMTLLEAHKLMATSRKRYTEAIRYGLLWLDTQSRDHPPQDVILPTLEAIAAMRATISVSKRGLSRRARAQKDHLSYQYLSDTGSMLTEEELSKLLRDVGKEYTEMVQLALAQVAMPREALRAQKLLVTAMAIGTGVAVRGGDFGNLTTAHVEEARTDGRMTLLSHKTSSIHGPLIIPVPAWLQWMLTRFVTLFRPALCAQRNDCASLFLNALGRPMHNMAQVVLTPYIKERTGKHVTFTTIRKFFETVSFNSFDDATQKLISQGQCHSDATANANYKLRQQSKAAETSHHVFDKLMGMSKAISDQLPRDQLEELEKTLGRIEAAKPSLPTAEAIVVDTVEETDTDELENLSQQKIVMMVEESPQHDSEELKEVKAESDETPDFIVQQLLDALPDPPRPRSIGSGSSGSDETETDEHGVIRTKPPGPGNRQFTDEQTEALLTAVAQWESRSHGVHVVPWRAVKRLAGELLQNKTPIMLKDKMRCLNRAAVRRLDELRREHQVPEVLWRSYVRERATKRRRGEEDAEDDSERSVLSKKARVMEITLN